jgi:hypothetical protein
VGISAAGSDSGEVDPAPETEAADPGAKSEAESGTGTATAAATETDSASPSAETERAGNTASERAVEATSEAPAKAAPERASGAEESRPTGRADAGEAADSQPPKSKGDASPSAPEAERAGSERAVETPSAASAKAAPESKPDLGAVEPRTPDGPEPTGTEGGSSHAPGSDARDEITAPAPATETDVSAAAPDTDTAPESDTGAEADPGTSEDLPATPRPTRPAPRSWSSRLGLRRRIQAWREKHPVAARVLSWTLTVLAAVLVYVCLQMPTTLNSLKPTQFMRLPAEAILGAVVLVSLPRRPRIVLAACSGALAAVVAILNMLDMGFNEYLGRGFNVILDWSLFGDAQSYLKDTLGGPATSGITVGLILFVLLLIVLVALATVRLGNLLAAHKAGSSRGALIAGTVWITCTAFGLQLSGVPLAADHAAAVVKLRTVAIRNTLRDEAEFKKVAKVDAFGNTPGSQLLPDLRGKDMIFTFIESYGRSAIEDPIMAPGVDETLAADTRALSKAGFAAKSGWLTSATYGGSSWLGHSTTMSGLWVNNQQRYRTVMASDHLSLTDAFKKTGDYDTVGVMPGIQKGWPEQSFYGLDKVYNAFQLGYQGPKFSWSTMPDQYALEQFQKQVHSKPRTDGKALMSLLILTSSHQPWAPIPKLVPWDQLGNGSIFDAIQKAGNKASDVIADSTKSREEYGKSIQYSVNSLTQWLERYGNDNTVLVFLGDHQPIARVSGSHASRDVPISIVAKDPKVLAKVDSWNWTDGLRPAHDAPVWKMSAFRDKFLTAYGSTPHPKTN